MKNRIAALALLSLYILAVWALSHAPTAITDPIRIDTVEVL